MMMKIFTMDECPYCNELKTLLDGDNIKYLEININNKTYVDEIKNIIELTKTERVPMVIIKNELLIPEISFTSISECFGLIKKFLS